MKRITNELNEYVIKTRRTLHQIPEAGMQEYETSRFIKRELTALGVEWSACTETGVVGVIHGGKPGKTVALRADMDGLPVVECNEVAYKSKTPGMMHACGHDAHMAMLLTAARILKARQDEIHGTVKLVFQPSEEGPVNGSSKMIEAGVMDGVDGIFGMHVDMMLDTGKVCVEAGPRMASGDYFEIKVTGFSGHGALPHQCVDAVVAAAAMVMNLQTLASREVSPIEPVVISVGTFHSGTRSNVISGETIMTGTTRTFSYELRAQLPLMMDRVIQSTAHAYRAKAELNYTFDLKPLINDKKCAVIAKTVAKKILGEDCTVELEKTMGAEDFSEYLAVVPGMYAILGVRNESKGTIFPHHHGSFQLDEDPLIHGAEIYAEYAIEFLKS